MEEERREPGAVTRKGPSAPSAPHAPLMTEDEKQEVARLIDAHERTVAVCKACAETTRDLAWEVKRGSVPPPESVQQTIEEAERVLAELGRIEAAIAEMKAALW